MITKSFVIKNKKYIKRLHNLDIVKIIIENKQTNKINIFYKIEMTFKFNILFGLKSFEFKAPYICSYDYFIGLEDGTEKRYKLYKTNKKSKAKKKMKNLYKLFKKKRQLSENSPLKLKYD